MPTTLKKTALGAVIGCIAGVVATGPMTVAMILWHRRLPAHERYSLPPREITMKLARKAGLAQHMDSETRAAATLVGHFGYGGAAGTLYGAISEEINAPAIGKGMAFGLLVWIASYLGWLPGLGILQDATRHPARRNLLMIGVHLIWGAALGAVDQVLQEEAKHPGLQPFSAPAPHRDA